MVATLWDDYSKAWRTHQQASKAWQVAMARQKVEQARFYQNQPAINLAREKLEGAHESLAQQREKTMHLEQAINEVNGKLDEYVLEQGLKKGNLDPLRVEYEQYLLTDPTKAKEWKGEVEKINKRLRELSQLIPDAETKKADIGGELSALRTAVTEQESELAALEKEYNDAFVELTTLDPSYMDGGLGKVLAVGFEKARNAWLIDFVAPTETVRTIYPPQVYKEYNFAQVPGSDLCVTCHINIDKPNFMPDNLVGFLEGEVERYNRTLAEVGKQLIEVHKPIPPRQRKELAESEPPWSEAKVKELRGIYLYDLVAAVNKHRESQGEKPLPADGTLFAHPRLDLFVTDGSPHPMVAIGCTVCHEGNGQETNFVTAVHTPNPFKVDGRTGRKIEDMATYEQQMKERGIEPQAVNQIKYWKDKDKHPGWAYAKYPLWEQPMMERRYVESSCARCHTAIDDVAHDAPQLYRGYQLVQQAGCIGCHKFEGIEPYAKTGPDLRHVSSKLESGFVYNWIKAPKRFRPSTWMPHFFQTAPGDKTHDQGDHAHALDYLENINNPKDITRVHTEIHAITHYLMDRSTPFEYEQVPEELEGDVQRGREIFNATGCLGCHMNMADSGDAMLGDYLRNVEKLDDSQVEQQLKAWTGNQKVRYLLAHEKDLLRGFELDQQDRMAKRITWQYTRVGPELSGTGSKIRDIRWLYSWLRNPSRYSPHTRMPSLRLTEAEALDIATYLMSLRHDDDARDADDPQREFSYAPDPLDGTMLDELVLTLKEKQMAPNAALAAVQTMTTPSKLDFLGEKMIAHYGCAGCHLIDGFENAANLCTQLSDWGNKDKHRLDFGFFSHEHHGKFKHEVFPDIPNKREGFINAKLRNPRIYDRQKQKGPYDKLKMPKFYLSDDQIDAIVTFTLSRRNPLVHSDLKKTLEGPRAALAAGRRLANYLNCVGCHKIEGNMPAMWQYAQAVEGGELQTVTTNNNLLNAPPWLHGEGAKIQHNWLYGFLQHVEPLRPWLKVRMPSFNLDHEWTQVLVEYFAALARSEAELLAEQLADVEAFMATSVDLARERGEPLELDPDNFNFQPLPGDDWYKHPSLLAAAKFLGDYAAENKLVTPLDLDLVRSSEEDVILGYRKVYHGTRFLAGLYDTPYPFVSMPRPQMDEQRFALGKQLLSEELKCLGCHAFNTPAVEGSGVSAPDLGMTWKRLRHGWVHHWFQEPATIQPGTKMPQWFPGGNSAFRDYGELAVDLESKFGETGVDQMKLLVDFIYLGGERGHEIARATPKPIPPATDDEEDDDWDDDDEDDDWEDEEEMDGDEEE